MRVSRWSRLLLLLGILACDKGSNTDTAGDSVVVDSAVGDSTVGDTEDATVADTTEVSDTASEETAVDSTPTDPAVTDAQLELFYGAHGGPDAFSEGYRTVVEAMLRAEDEVFRGDFDAAGARIAAVWAERPYGDASWSGLGTGANGTNVGDPPAYYGLRMLEQIVADQAAVDTAPATATAVLKVILVGCAEGPLPKSWAELQAGTGAIEKRTLDPAVLADDYALVRQSLKLWQRYVLAATDGRLSIALDIVELPDTCAPTISEASPFRIARIGSTASVFDALGSSNDADWYWIVYPSMVPEEYPDFTTTEFISGGMGVAPNGGPLLLGDDRWLTRKPPHLGDGPYTEVERRVYLPQWMMHEHFHHFLREWPDFGLEASGHQWFDRSTWPADFVGRFEPDYYTEALNKRLKGASPPMHIRLRYAAPTADAFAALTMDDVLGTYHRLPFENGYHIGRIEAADGGYQWRNDAGVTWRVTNDLANGRLATGADNPYPELDGFYVSLKRDAAGDYTSAIEGLRFGGDLYVLQ